MHYYMYQSTPSLCGSRRCRRRPRPPCNSPAPSSANAQQHAVRKEPGRELSPSRGWLRRTSASTRLKTVSTCSDGGASPVTDSMIIANSSFDTVGCFRRFLRCVPLREESSTAPLPSSPRRSPISSPSAASSSADWAAALAFAASAFAAAASCSRLCFSAKCRSCCAAANQ